MAIQMQTLHEVKRFAVKHKEGLFLASLALIILTAIVYKYRNQKLPERPLDKTTIEKVKLLDSKALKQLLDAGANPNSQSENGIPALVVAIALATLFEKDAVKTFDCLMVKKPNVNVCDNKKRTPLHYAVVQWDDKGKYFAQELLKKGAKW